MSVVYKFYKRCHGCAALVSYKGKFVCRLGTSIRQEEYHGVKLAPRPETKCYKPKTQEDIKEAVDKIANRK